MPRLLSLLLLSAIALLPAAAPAHAKKRRAPAKPKILNSTTNRGLTTGFTDPVFLTNRNDERGPRMQEAAAAHGSLVRVDLSWWGVADQRPSGDMTNPANPAYNWTPYDAALRDAAARGQEVVWNVFRAPPWAEGPGRPGGIEPGTWRPDAAAYGAFATAAARRYSGNYPDPLHPGSNLPRVRYWEAWNEPNIWVLLQPQWVQSGGQQVPASPGIYRSLLNAFYAGVKSVAADNVVIGGATSPYGDDPGGNRMRPARFYRELFCLSDNLQPEGCPDPPHLDVVDHHPYDVGGPKQRALNADDISIPDIGKLSQIVGAAQRSGHIVPGSGTRLWAGEISYESQPPDPGGVFAMQHARWLEYSFYSLWAQGVDSILWFQVRDAAIFPDSLNSFQSGIEFIDGRRKPTARAFMWPFVADRVSATKVRVWGKPPDAGVVTVQYLYKRRWRRLALVRPGDGGVFYRSLRFRRKVPIRAMSNGHKISISWPPKENLINPDKRS